MKIVRRVLLGLLFVVVLVVVLLVGSVAADYVLGAGRVDRISNTTIPGMSGIPDVRAYVAKPEGAGPFPVVIMIHEFFGLNESIVSKADGLAAEGYLVVAPDTFRGSTTSWIPRAIYQVSTTKPEQVNADLDTVYAWLEAQPAVDSSRIAIIGFCYGGRTALAYSLHNNQLAATVVFYGSPETDPAVLKNLPGPVLGIFGGADQSIPLENVTAFETALTQAGVQHEITIYPDQPHAFVQDMAGIRAGGAQGQAWAQMLKFLGVHLSQPGAGQTGQSIAYLPEFDWQYYLMLTYEHAFGTASHMH
ncbi:MAG: dienelactone hydrolase family protein [Anaerolineales bacterium]|nr:MAG: dienelactone hydrolase family protein [Anaerolineales bacterium]